ncbi:hypothetical protein ACWOFR_05735 [Carnobacterium gallinarum]|uniref:hypothetical protein n=1 Tax=Carnobacterium gallinarum TaxID=2749 RepID=UPI000558DCC8|nr:hypothetical protein [Carnobacterium gallinarum]
MKEKTMQKKLIYFLSLFMIVMFGFTFLSKSMNSLTIPKVSVVNLESKILTDEWIATGIVKKSKNVPIFTEEDQRIKDIYVNLGQNVTSETPLFQVDLDYLNQKIAEKQKELDKQQQIVNSQNTRTQNDVDMKNLKITQAKEAYSQVVEIEDQKIRSATKEVEETSVELKKQENQSNIELKAVYEEKQRSLESAKTEKNSAVLQAQHLIELAEQEPNNVEIDTASIDLEQANEALQRLVNLKEANGIVKAQMAGIVSKVAVLIGGVTSQEAVVLIEDGGSTSILSMEVDKMNKEYVKVGQTGKVTGITKNGVERLQDVATVLEVKPNAENQGILDVKVELNDEEFEYDSVGTFYIEKSSQKYPYTIPTDAVHEGKNGFYVLVVDEKQSILGNEKVAKEVAVKILARTPTTVAIQENKLLADEEIVMIINKTIVDGDKIRVIEGSTNDE